MHVISQKRLKAFWMAHPDAELPLRAWWTTMKATTFATPHEVRAVFPSVDFTGKGRAIFDICGNRYRLVADIRYRWGRVYIVAVLIHAEYDRVNVDDL